MTFPPSGRRPGPERGGFWLVGTRSLDGLGTVAPTYRRLLIGEPATTVTSIARTLENEGRTGRLTAVRAAD